MSGNSNDVTLPRGGAASASAFACGLRTRADRRRAVGGLLTASGGDSWWQTLTMGATEE